MHLTPDALAPGNAERTLQQLDALQAAAGAARGGAGAGAGAGAGGSAAALGSTGSQRGQQVRVRDVEGMRRVEALRT